MTFMHPVFGEFEPFNPFEEPVPSGPRDYFGPRYTSIVVNGEPVSMTANEFATYETKRRPHELDFASGIFSVEIGNYAASDREAIVVIECALGDEVWEVTGSSRRDRSDPPNKDAGLLLALSRALAIASRHIERQAEGKIKHAADMREMRTARRQPVKKPTRAKKAVKR